MQLKKTKTGIFETWEECKRSSLWLPNSEFKSFKSKRDAINYLTG